MRLEPRSSPRYPELMVFRNGKIYDSNTGKILNLVEIHQNSSRGPVAYWSTVDKTYTLDVLKMVYETYVSGEILTNNWMIDFRDGTDIIPENLKKTRKHEKNNPTTRPVGEFDSWMGGDEIYMW